MENLITFKRGDTLSLIITRRDDSDNPLTGEADRLFAQIRNANDVLITNMTISETATLGDYELSVSASTTKNFPIGELYFDIEYRDTNLVWSTETYSIFVEKDVTRNA